ncbi:olfactory receptor 1-like [Pelobates fuscus]|uniref:olfactory receptor 1-like n=1 Tax=Pelobates fuscus TaxID=191477 RepID=UPI002FE48279
MSYDRYLAICKPLHYISIMNLRLTNYLVLLSWIVAFLQSAVTYMYIIQLKFCGPNIINHFFCDLAPVLELSCSDTSVAQIEISIFVIIGGLSQISFIIFTYVSILISILGISSSTGRQKAFSTCSSHLAVVCTYYGTMITLYAAPSRGYSSNLNKILSLLNTMITPLFNPMIYSLKNNEINTLVITVFLRKRAC